VIELAGVEKRVQQLERTVELLVECINRKERGAGIGDLQAELEELTADPKKKKKK